MHRGRGGLRGGRGRDHPHSDDSFRSRAAMPVPKTPIQTSFASLSRHLDSRNDKRERIYKLSRDLTKASKKVIFVLQRPLSDKPQSTETEVDDLSLPAELISQAVGAQIEVFEILSAMIDEINEQSEFDVVPSSFSSDDYSSPSSSSTAESSPAASAESSPAASLATPTFSFYFYRDRYSFGIQEFIESASFFHYLQHRSLITREQVEDLIEKHTKRRLVVSSDDYLLGIMDLGGELMRFATNNASRSRSFLKPLTAFLNSVEFQIQSLPSLPHSSYNKLQVWRDSTEKIETLEYRLGLREKLDSKALELVNAELAQFGGQFSGPTLLRSRDAEFDGGDDRESKRTKFHE